MSEAKLLAQTTWPAVGHPLLLVPLGSTEQHGPHLPFDTDTAVAEAVSSAVAERFTDATVAPAIAYGSSGEHQDFPGTISIGHDALALLLTEFGRSACTWADRVVFVNGHGGNIDALADAVTTLIREGRPVGWLPCAATGYAGAHAGRSETSLIEAIRPGSVGPAVEPGNTTPIADLLPALRAHGVRAVAPNGILGDPRGASSSEGEELLRRIVDDAHARLIRWMPDERGMLQTAPFGGTP